MQFEDYSYFMFDGAVSDLDYATVTLRIIISRRGDFNFKIVFVEVMPHMISQFGWTLTGGHNSSPSRRIFVNYDGNGQTTILYTKLDVHSPSMLDWLPNIENLQHTILNINGTVIV